METDLEFPCPFYWLGGGMEIFGTWLEIFMEMGGLVNDILPLLISLLLNPPKGGFYWTDGGPLALGLPFGRSTGGGCCLFVPAIGGGSTCSSFYET